jgi:hypothetical protein
LSAAPNDNTETGSHWRGTWAGPWGHRSLGRVLTTIGAGVKKRTDLFMCQSRGPCQLKGDGAKSIGIFRGQSFGMQHMRQVGARRRAAARVNSEPAAAAVARPADCSFGFTMNRFSSEAGFGFCASTVMVFPSRGGRAYAGALKKTRIEPRHELGWDISGRARDITAASVRKVLRHVIIFWPLLRVSWPGRMF